MFGLTDEQARSHPAASALCLGGLVKHAARTERRWIVAGIAGGRGTYVSFRVPEKPEVAVLVAQAASRAGALWAAHRGLS